MSDFSTAFAFFIPYEDPEQTWAVNPDLCSKGKPGPCFAIAGINSSDWPQEFDSILGIPQAERGPAILSFYDSKIWTPMGLVGVEAQDLANRVLDEGFWSGPGTAVRLLQRAINSLQSVPADLLAVDGLLGPESLAAVNEIAGDTAVMVYRQERVSYLQSLPMYRSAASIQQVAYLKRASA